jgi:hypothetical protein
MPEIAECLQIRTQSLRNEIEWIKAEHGEGPQAVLEHLRQLRSELSACGELLRDPGFLPGGSQAQRVASEYRDCLQRLQEALPILQSKLLAQHSHLRPQKEHLEAAGDWLQCSKTTLE